MMPKTKQKLLEHRIKLRGGLMPPNDGIAEPEKALKIGQYSPKLITSTNLGNARWVSLHKSAQTAECRVFLFIITNLVQGHAPCLREFGQMGSDEVRVHQTNTTDGHGSVFV